MFFFRTVLRQSHRVSEATATSSPIQLLPTRTQPSKSKTWVPLRHTIPSSLQCHGACKAWLKWRGPLPMARNLGRRSVQGTAVFVYRYRRGKRLVMRFWVRQRVEPPVVRWSKLRSITFPPRKVVVTEKEGAGRGNGIQM